MMLSALNKILLRTFVYGFYRTHAGLLLALFVGFFINFFFTSVLNQTHLTSDQILLNNFKLAITSVSNPVAMGILFVIWLIYTVKSCKYVSAQLVSNQNQFLFYSSTSMEVRKQFQAWFIVQTAISLPIIALGIFGSAVGLAFGHYVIPFIIPLYLLLLISWSALYYTRLLNKLDERQAKYDELNLVKRFPKPFFSLFFYQIIYRTKIIYGVTKIISGVIIISVYGLFGNSLTDIRTVAVAGAGVILAHSVLIYQSNEFELSELRVFRNLPFSKKRVYVHFTTLYFLLTLPESLYIFYLYDLLTGLHFSLITLSFAVLFRSILYLPRQEMSSYMQIVFGIFVVSTLVIMFGWMWWMTVINASLSFFLFNHNYYRSLDK